MCHVQRACAVGIAADWVGASEKRVAAPNIPKQAISAEELVLVQDDVQRGGAVVSGAVASGVMASGVWMMRHVTEAAC
jgi:hypothetical protein